MKSFELVGNFVYKQLFILYIFLFFFFLGFLEVIDLLKSKCFWTWVSFGKQTGPMQSSEETLPARKSAAIRKLFGFLATHLAHGQGAWFQCNFIYRLGFLKIWAWASTAVGDFSLHLGDIVASRLPGPG